ncbi:ABC transporter permease [Candidatus Dependentiae bacterium]
MVSSFRLASRKISSYMLPVFVAIAYCILYAPIIVLVIFSFNKNPLSYKWHGFSFVWYKELFASVEILDALKNSLIVAFSSVFLSVTMALFYVFYGKSSFLNRLVILFYGSLIAPEIVLAVGLLSIFTFFSMPLGLTTLIVGHTLVGLAFVVPIIKNGLAQMDYRLIEASMDLGATEKQTFYKIVIPVLYPAIISSALLVFIVSLDDFLISFFCAGASTLTLPMYIFAVIKSGATPIVNALSAILLVVSTLLILILTAFKLRTRLF